MARNLITTNHGLPISTLQSQQTGRSHSPVDLEFKYKDVTVELTAATFAFNHHSAYHHSLQLPNHHQQTVHSQDSTPPSPTFNMTAFKASTCCRQGESAECACGMFIQIVRNWIQARNTNYLFSPASYLQLWPEARSSLHLRQGQHRELHPSRCSLLMPCSSCR